MTAHIVLSILSLLLFVLSLKRLLSRENGSFPWLCFSFCILVMLPISYSGMSVIAHFLFEMSSDNLLWYTILYPLLWLSSAYYLIRLMVEENRDKQHYGYAFVLPWLVFGLWFLFGITQSAYEAGIATPSFNDSFYLFSYWLSVQLFVLACLLILILSRLKEKAWFSFLVSIALLLLYAAIFASSFC